MLNTVSSFTILLSIGMIAMYGCIIFRRKRYTISIWKSTVLTLLLTISGIIGAKLLYVLESGFQSWNGVSFFGSVFLIPILMPFCGSILRIQPRQVMDICAPCVAIMIACLRVNCFLNRCCGGWSLCIGSFCFQWPTQMLESIGDIVLMGYLLKYENSQNTRGQLYPIFMVFYSIMRFFIEFLRSTSKDWLWMSHGQWFSLIAVLVGVIWIRIIRKNYVTV